MAVSENRNNPESSQESSQIAAARRYERLAYDSLRNNNLKEAESNFQKAWSQIEKTGDEPGKAFLLGNLGNLYFKSQNWEQAEDHYRRALLKMEELKDDQGIESTLGNLGNVLLYKGQYDDAKDHYRKALEVTRRTNNQENQAMYCENLGQVAIQQDDLVEAEGHFTMAMSTLSEGDEVAKKRIEERLKFIKNHSKYIECREKEIKETLEKLDTKTQQKEILNDRHIISKNNRS